MPFQDSKVARQENQRLSKEVARLEEAASQHCKAAADATKHLLIDMQKQVEAEILEFELKERDHLVKELEQLEILYRKSQDENHANAVQSEDLKQQLAAALHQAQEALQQQKGMEKKLETFQEMQDAASQAMRARDTALALHKQLHENQVKVLSDTMRQQSILLIENQELRRDCKEQVCKMITIV